MNYSVWLGGSTKYTSISNTFIYKHIHGSASEKSITACVTKMGVFAVDENLLGDKLQLHSQTLFVEFLVGAFMNKRARLLQPLVFFL